MTTGKRVGSSGFGAIGIVTVLAVLGIVAFIGWQMYKAQQSSTGQEASGGLVGIPPPAETPTRTEPASSPDGLPRGFTAYSNSQYGFSFAYPQVWGGLQMANDPSAVLSLATNKITAYSLADALQVSVTKTVNFRQRANDAGVVVSPTPNGVAYEWKVVDKGADKSAQLNKTYASPPVVYRSGKTQVYSFSLADGACNYTVWAFASGDNFVRLRLPSFCVSSKPGDAEVQAGHKAEFDAIKAQMLPTITVF